MSVIQGTFSDDTLTGNSGQDFVYGWQGNDFLDGADGDDILYGDNNNDTLIGSNGNDLLAGSQGSDVLDGGDGNDIVYGGADDDTIAGGLGSDRLFGDGGSDRFFLEFDADTVTGGKDGDIFILSPTLGGQTLADAAIITDFSTLEDSLELTGGLTFSQLNIFQGTGFYNNDTIIQDSRNGRYLAILLNVPTPSFVERFIPEAPPLTEPEPLAETPTEQSYIVFADLPPVTASGTPTPTTPPTTPPGTTPPTTPPGTTPPTTPPGTTQSIAGILEFTGATFSVNEDGTPVVIVTVKRSGGSTGTVSAKVTLTNGTATAPTDYNNAPLTVNFSDRDTTSKTLTIPIVNDTLTEGTETVKLTLGSPTRGAIIGIQNTATLEILDDEVPSPGILQFSAADFSVNEDGTPVVAVTVTRGGGKAGAISAQIIPVDGTATAPDDYSNSPVTVNFADGDNAPKTVTIPLIDDSFVEGDESLNLNLINPTGGATLGSQKTASLTIKDNEQAAAVQFSNSSYSVSENAGTASIAVTRSNGNGIVSVNYATSTPTTGVFATAGADYTATNGTLTFNVGETSKTIGVPIVNDSLVEQTERVQLTLSNPTGGAQLGTQSTAVLEIADDEAGVLEFISASSSETEGNSGSSVNKSVAKIKRSGGSNGAVSVQVGLDTPSGTATAPGDYANNFPIALTWANGDTAEKDVFIPIVEDAIDEINETLNLKLINASGGATIGTQKTTSYTIVNDDSNLPTAANLVAPTLTAGGGATYNFTVDYADDAAVNVSSLDNADIVVISPNNAAIPATFVSVTPSGNGTPRTATYQIAAPGGSWDVADNGSYSVNLVANQVLDNTGNAAAAINLGSFTVNAPPLDATVTLVMSPQNLYEDSGTGMVYTFTRTDSGNAPLSAPLTVNFSVGGTATLSNFDYTQTGANSFESGSGTVTFAPNSSTATVTINPVTDTRIEPDETAILTLENGNGYVSGTLGAVTATILDDDGTVLNTQDSGYGSLRQAILNANLQNSEPQTINLTGIAGTILLQSTLPAIANDMTFNGPGANQLKISGNNAYRIFTVNSGKTVRFNRLTIADSFIGNNMAPVNSDGGIVNNGGILYLTDSNISNNKTRFYGGGVVTFGGQVHVINSTIFNNIIDNNTSDVVQSNGGGIANFGGTVYVLNSTLSGNSNGNIGNASGIYNQEGTTYITNSTISANKVGVVNTNGIVYIKNTAIAGNSFNYDIDGIVISQGYNLIGSVGNDNFSSNTTGDRYGDPNNTTTPNSGATESASAIDPKLGPLQDNGGPTLTHALLSGSPARNAGDPNATGPDQRGILRSGTPDIGAFENNASVRLGTSGNDVLTGQIAPNPFSFPFVDTFFGGLGTDTLTGNGNNDTFIYSSPGEGGDTITDLNNGDKFQFTSASFGNLNATVFSGVTVISATDAIASHELIILDTPGVTTKDLANTALSNQVGTSSAGAGGTGGAVFFVYTNSSGQRVLGYDPDVDSTGGGAFDMAILGAYTPGISEFTFV